MAELEVEYRVVFQSDGQIILREAFLVKTEGDWRTYRCCIDGRTREVGTLGGWGEVDQHFAWFLALSRLRYLQEHYDLWEVESMLKWGIQFIEARLCELDERVGKETQGQ